MSGQLNSEDDTHSAILRKAWERCLHLLSAKVSKVTLNSYMRSAHPLRYDGNVVTLGVVSAYARDWLEKKYANQIRSALEFHLDVSGLEVQYVVMTRDVQHEFESAALGASSAGKSDDIQTSLSLESDEEYLEPELAAPAPSPGSQSLPMRSSGRSGAGRQKEPPALPVPCLPLNDRYMFENYLECRGNRLAKVSAMAVAAKPGEAYNPLFVYGGSGLGKSHLMQAIAQVIKRTRSSLKVAYVSAEYFVQGYVTAIREHSTEEFRRQYRRIDVWLVDDIQFIAGKGHTKEEFFHTFNSLYQAGKQIVIASDCSPRELHQLDERLRSRFQSGLIADITPPDFETRVAFLHKLRERENAVVSAEVMNYIADAIQSNMRTLEGALTRLIAYSSIMNAPINAELAQSVLSEYFIDKPICVRKLTIDDIIHAVSEPFGTTSLAIKGPGRNKDVALARHVAMYLTRELLPQVNLTDSGMLFGGRDHSTIIYGCQRIRQLLEMDQELRALVQSLTKQLLQ